MKDNETVANRIVGLCANTSLEPAAWYYLDIIIDRCGAEPWASLSDGQKSFILKLTRKRKNEIEH